MSIRFRFFGGDGFKEIKSSVNTHEEHLRQQISDLGDETSQKMKEVIEQNKVRPQAGEPKTLEETINVEHFADGGWGVGDINVLNQKVPYWRAVNFGSAHMVGKKVPMGAFNPGDPEPNAESSRQGRWKKGDGKHIFTVKNPIPPMNYIEKTVNFLKLKFASLTAKF